MITLVGFEGELLHWSELLLLQSSHLVGVDDFGGEGTVDTGSLDGDDEVTSILNKHRRVKSEDASLIWLRDVGENAVDHRDEHSVLLGVSCVLNDWDNVGSLLSHVDKVTADTLGEFNSIDGTGWADQV